MDNGDILKKVSAAIGKASNILVTINRNPSVDEVAAAIGLVFVLESMDKFTTAIFSGALPPATEFLNPAATFESNVDVLRDFIITLDKDKVDRVRYRVEGDFVRILVTPYKTILSAEDVRYENGEYNVDLVITLGAVSQNDLDDAVRGVTRILHDAVVLAINDTRDTPNFATLAWNDERATSYCEMVTDLAELLGENEMSENAATALLTGIISETQQFRNSKTTSKSLQVAAKLMGYGANQQLISVKLEEEKEVVDSAPSIAAAPEAISESEPTVAESGAAEPSVAAPVEPVVAAESIATTVPENEPAVAAPLENEIGISEPTQATGEEPAQVVSPAPVPQPLSHEEIMKNIDSAIAEAGSGAADTIGTGEAIVAAENSQAGAFGGPSLAVNEEVKSDLGGESTQKTGLENVASLSEERKDDAEGADIVSSFINKGTTSAPTQGDVLADLANYKVGSSGSAAVGAPTVESFEAPKETEVSTMPEVATQSPTLPMPPGFMPSNSVDTVTAPVSAVASAPTAGVVAPPIMQPLAPVAESGVAESGSTDDGKTISEIEESLPKPVVNASGITIEQPLEASAPAGPSMNPVTQFRIPGQ